MYRSISLIIVAALLCIVSHPVFAAGVHKWVDENGVTHYSDEAPTSSATQVTFIEVPATYSTTANVENDYYSITNQWMRLHQERIAREKIKLEKAAQKAAQQPVAPQVVYVNDSYSDRYAVAYPNYFPNKRHRFNNRFDRRHGDRNVKRHGRKNSSRLLGQSHKRHSQSRRKSSGFTAKRR